MASSRGPGAPQAGSTDIERSSAGAEWVRNPSDTDCTPEAPTLRSVCRVMPPEASSSARPATRARRLPQLRGVHVVEQQALRPRCQRYLDVRERAALDLHGHALPGAARAPGGRPPRSRPRARCGCPSRGPRRRGPSGGCDRRRPPPPASRARAAPGVVLRVSSTFTPVPRSSCTHAAVAVAMPDRWPEEVQRHPLAVSSARASPSSASTSAGGSASHSPSGRAALDAHQRVQAAERPPRRPRGRTPRPAAFCSTSGPGPPARHRRPPPWSRRAGRRPRRARARSGPRRPAQACVLRYRRAVSSRSCRRSSRQSACPAVSGPRCACS